jgi:DNA-binding CsgD family transcriptional regulator
VTAPPYSAQPGIRMSHREVEVLTALLEGLSYKQIADRLAISGSTVRFHTQRIFRKYEVHDRYELFGKFGRFEVKVRWVPHTQTEAETKASANDASRMFRHRVRIQDGKEGR